MLGSSGSVFAQFRWEDRVFVHAGGGYQIDNKGFSYEDSQVIFEELATAGFDVKGTNDFVWEVGGGVRIVNNLGVGVTYTQYNAEENGLLTVTIPHPVFFNMPETSTLEVPAKREEKVVHIEIAYVFPLGSKVQLRAFGGPSHFDFKQGAVADVMLNGSLNDFLEFSVDLSNPIRKDVSGTVWGYNLGADLSVLFSKNIGVGGAFRWSRASTDVENVLEFTRTETPNTSASIDLGGFQLLGGIRLRF